MCKKISAFMVMIMMCLLMIGCGSKESTVAIKFQFIATDVCPAVEEFVASYDNEDDKVHYVIDANTYAYDMDKELHKQYLEVAKGGKQGASLLIGAMEMALDIEAEDYFSEYSIDDECRNFNLYTTNKEKFNEIKEGLATKTSDVFFFLMEGAQAIWLVEPEDRYIRTRVYDSDSNELLYDSGEVTKKMVYEMLFGD